MLSSVADPDLVDMFFWPWIRIKRVYPDEDIPNHHEFYENSHFVENACIYLMTQSVIAIKDNKTFSGKKLIHIYFILNNIKVSSGSATLIITKQNTDLCNFNIHTWIRYW